MTRRDQRLLDCHAAWMHGVLPLEELYHEIWLASPEPTEAEHGLRQHARMLGEAAGRLIEQRMLNLP